MIKIIDKDFKLNTEFREFCKSSSFGTRIYSHYLCYGYELNFVDFWVQITDENITCAICRIDGDFVLCLCDNADFTEVSAFLSFQDKHTITFDEKYLKYLETDCGDCSYGDVLEYFSSDEDIPDYKTLSPQLKDYHELLLTCESDDFFVPDYLYFLSDVSRRQQRNICEICGVKIDDAIVSCAMTVSHTDFSVILGAVATHPEHRKHGYAGCVVRKLAESFVDDRSVYIYTTVERNTRFYEGLGFRVCGRWVKFNIGG